MSEHRMSPLPLWDKKDVAAFFKVKVRTTDDWAQRGIGPLFTKINGARRYRPEDCYAFAEENIRRSTSDTAEAA